MSKIDTLEGTESEPKSKTIDAKDKPKMTPAEKRRAEVAEYKKTGYLFGRPVEYKAEEYPRLLIEHMKKGFSFRSFAGVIGVGFDTVYTWAEEYKDFSDARKIGESSQLNYDESLLDELSKGVHGKAANASTHIFKMKNCHKWTDKVEVDQTIKEIKINIDSDDTGL